MWRNPRRINQYETGNFANSPGSAGPRAFAASLLVARVAAGPSLVDDQDDRGPAGGPHPLRRGEPDHAGDARRPDGHGGAVPPAAAARREPRANRLVSGASTGRNVPRSLARGPTHEWAERPNHGLGRVHLGRRCSPPVAARGRRLGAGAAIEAPYTPRERRAARHDDSAETQAQHLRVGP